MQGDMDQPRGTDNRISGRAFCKYPKRFITDERLRELPQNAKVLYALMLDRLSLSKANGWHDEEGMPYIYYAHEAVMQDLNISTNTASECVRALAERGLISRAPQGFGHPMRIYVRDILAEDTNERDENAESQNMRVSISNSESRESQKMRPSVSEYETPDSQKMRPNKTENNKTNRNKTEGVRPDDHRTPDQELDDYYRERYGCTLREMQMRGQEVTHDSE